MFFGNIWNNILDWFSERSERRKLVREFNEAAKRAFILRQAPTLLKAEITLGNSEYRHQFSSFLSGFRVLVFQGRPLAQDELIYIGQTIVSDDQLMRQLVVLGFDTLEIFGDGDNYGRQWQLKDYMQIGY